MGPVVVLGTAEHRREQGQVGDGGDPGRHRRSDGTDEDVSVADVGDLVGYDAANLVAVKCVEEPLGDTDPCVVLVPPRGERVGLGLGRDEQAGWGGPARWARAPISAWSRSSLPG